MEPIFMLPNWLIGYDVGRISGGKFIQSRKGRFSMLLSIRINFSHLDSLERRYTFNKSHTRKKQVDGVALVQPRNM